MELSKSKIFSVFTSSASQSIIEAHREKIFKELFHEVDSSNEININIIEKRPSFFKVTISLVFEGQRIFLIKTGRKIISTLKKAKRSMLRKIRLEKKLKISKRRQFVKRRVAS